MFGLFSMVIYGVLFVTWTKRNWLNMFVKLILFSMFAWSAFETLCYFGFIVK